MTKNIKLDFTVDEINALLDVLGNQPTKSGLFPLMTKIHDTAVDQLDGPKAPRPEENRGKPAVVKKEIPVPSAVTMSDPFKSAAS